MLGWYQGDWGAMAFLGMGMMLVFWGSVVALVVWAIVRLTRPASAGPSAPDSARAILDRRFASGEIDADEYARARRTLEARPGQE